MTISEQALAKSPARQAVPIKDVPRDGQDRDRLREEWRLIAKEWVAAEALASELEEGRKVLLSELKLALIEQGMGVTKAEDVARCSAQFKSYLRKMHDARHRANDIEIEAKSADRRYWDNNNAEATQRSEMRMSR